ncbi:MAG: hypothetical protein IT159_13190 [Bryobacterales bacterium]|nr:hypothetical protein [Bryobacterales bacterium]
MLRILLVTACVGVCLRSADAADYPQAEISNGRITAKLYLPDAAKGFYRGTRFDWSGIIHSLVYRGHDYFGPWFDAMDPKVRDYTYENGRLIAGACSAATGPAEEFQVMGFDEAKPGGTFLKIGVGALRKDERPYASFTLFEIADGGKWTVRRSRGSVEFTHQLSDPASGYGYVYRKTVRLEAGKPVLTLEHSLRNTGKQPIRGTVYNHNFLTLDKRPTGPDFTLSVPYRIQTTRSPDKEMAEVRDRQIVYLRTLEDKQVVSVPVEGFGADPGDHDIRIENRTLGAGMRIVGDRPLADNRLWSIRRVLAIEPFIALAVQPGEETSWKWTYEFYTLPAAAR